MARLQYVAKISQKSKNSLSRVHARHRRQTDGFAIALAKRNVVSARLAKKQVICCW